MRMALRAARGIALGVWHFVVGDTPEFSVAVVILVGFALVLHRFHPVLWVGLPVLVLVVLGASLWRQQRRVPPPSPAARTPTAPDPKARLDLG